MLLKGLQKLTLLDYPGRMACTVFTGGCNFRCPFCHNASLVVPTRQDDYEISEDDFFAFLESRKNKLSGVCITGGEPTLMPDIARFIGRIKEMGFSVKLDTNGYRPEVLESLVESGLIDYVAMDIKTCAERYPTVAGVDIDIDKIKRSAAFLMKGKIPFEFRTTIVKELHGKDDMKKIGEWLAGDESFFLQGFIDSGDVICDGLNGYDKKDLTDLLNVLKRYIPNAQIRG